MEVPFSVLFSVIDEAAPALLALGVGLLLGVLLAYAMGKFSREEARAPIEAASQGDMTLIAKFDEVLHVVDEIAA